MQTNKKQKGFTLIEAIVVISIIVSLTAIAIPNMRSYRSHIVVRNAAKDLQSVLWGAQALSLSPRSAKTTAYFFNISLCPASCVTSSVQDESITTDSLGNPTVMVGSEATEGLPVLDRFVSDKKLSIADIKLYKNGVSTSYNSLRISFAVGNRTGGNISLSDATNSLITGDKAEIIISSPDTKIRYKITINAATHIITMDVVRA